MRVDEHTIELASGPAFYRTASVASQAASPAPAVYLHDVPTSCDDWAPLLQRTGGIAPDLLGFGRSAKGGHLDYTISGLADFTSRLLDHLGVAQLRLVGHGWGALVALELAARDPTRVQRLALIAPPPLTAGHAWRGLERVWRIPALGELAMGAIAKPVLARRLRGACANPSEAWPRSRIDAVWGYFDQGTQRAILRLHRNTAADHLEAMAGRLTDGATAVVRGQSDSRLTAAQAEAIARLLPSASVIAIPGTGHWPWLERPEATDTLAQLVEGRP